MIHTESDDIRLETANYRRNITKTINPTLRN
jgi:hypothetical protein